MREVMDRVESIHFYPIKSCQRATIDGEQPLKLSVSMTGFEYAGVCDRDWVLADEEGLFVSQRSWDACGHVNRNQIADRKLAVMQVDVQPDHLALSALGFGSFELDSQYNESGKQRRQVSIHNKTLWAWDEGDHAAAYFSRYLQRDVRLLRADRSRQRMLTEGYVLNGTSNKVAAADGMPFLLTSQASLDYLHDLKGYEHGRVPMDRFRPNIVISGESFGAFLEDSIHVLRIGAMTAFVVKACARCPITKVNQTSGEWDNHDLLTPYRRGWRRGSDVSGKTEAFFGQNLNHVALKGTAVQAGDPVVVLEPNHAPNVIFEAAA